MTSLSFFLTKPKGLQWAAAVLVAILCLAPESAFASRVVFFDVFGKNETFSYDEYGFSGAFVSQCIVTLSNSGNTEQTYTVTFTGTAEASAIPDPDPPVDPVAATPAVVAFAAAGTKNGALTGPSLSGTLAAGAKVVWAWKFPALEPRTKSRQEVRCQGSITVDDSTGGPGFLTANGVIITWMQSSRAVRLVGSTKEMKAGTTLTTTPFYIGEGRPF